MRALVAGAGRGYWPRHSIDAGFRGSPLADVAIPSEAAVVALTEALAGECVARRIRVNAVAPGAVTGRLTDAILAAGVATTYTSVCHLHDSDDRVAHGLSAKGRCHVPRPIISRVMRIAKSSRSSGPVGDQPCPGCLGAKAVLVRASVFGRSSLFRCTACGTEVLRPQPDDLRLAEIYGPNYYAPWAAEDPGIVDAMKRATFAPLLDACGLRAGTTLLDVGCATGSLLAEVSKRGARGYGIDLNAEAIKVAQQRAPDATLHIGYATDQPFPGVIFDAVVMIDFLEHVRDPEAELRVARQRMRPGAKLVISTPRVDSLVRRAAGRRWPQYREEHLTYFSRRGIAALLDRCGLEVERVAATRKVLTLAYAYGQAAAFPVPVLTQLTTAGYRILPALRHRPFRVSLGEMTVVARRQEL
jgi:2-polyprenyl-3-methyl-5-hydroxy-6-metoxy-1,4-benzoquinol methylase